MNKESSTITQPIQLENLADFEHFAKDAKLILYSPEYFHSPFLDDAKRLRRLALMAIGVKVDGLTLTFKYVLDYEEISSESKTWEDQTAEANKFMTSLLTSLGAKGNLIQGTLDVEPALGEALAMRP